MVDSNGRLPANLFPMTDPNDTMVQMRKELDRSELPLDRDLSDYQEKRSRANSLDDIGQMANTLSSELKPSTDLALT